MLRETAHEMSLIAFEKKQLLQQWKGALIGLARRDEALTAASNALKEAQSAARSATMLCALVDTRLGGQNLCGTGRQLSRLTALKPYLVYTSTVAGPVGYRNTRRDPHGSVCL